MTISVHRVLFFLLRLETKGPDAAFQRLQGLQGFLLSRVSLTKQVTVARKSNPDPDLHNSSQNSHLLS